MGLLRRIAASLWRRDRNAGDIADEMAFHLEERTRENLARGMTPEAAAHDARARFGNPVLLSDRTRDMDVIGWLDSTGRESVQALRGLRRRPGLALTAVLSLALGIGATSAIFSVVDAALLRPLPIPDHDRVVVLQEYRRDERLGGNAARFRDWATDARSLTDLTGIYDESATLLGRGEPERVSVLRTFGPLLALLQVEIPLGRGFSVEEERGTGAPVALLGHGLWQRRFGADPAVLGQSLTLGATSYTIIGVLPASFGYPEREDVVAPAPAGFQSGQRKGGNYFGILGRLAPGVTLAGAQAEVDGIAERFGRNFPETDRDLRARLLPVQEVETAEARTPLLLLSGAVLLVLLIACVNIAGLLLARGAERHHEAAIRVALGAGRASLLRLYLIESGWLALAGGLGGLLLASAGVPLLQRLLPADLPRLGSATLDWRVTLFALLTAMGCGLLFGWIPAWQASRSAGTLAALRDGGRTTTGGRRLLARRLLVVTQVAISMLLLVGAGLLARSLYQMRASPTGVRAEAVLAVRIEFPWDTEDRRLHEFYRQALESFAAIPGVAAAGLTDHLPLGGGTQSRPLRLERPEAGATPLPSDQAISYRAVSDGYFAVVGTPLLEGRVWRDDLETRRELVVNQTFARRYLPAGGALGARLTFDVESKPGTQPTWYEVVGVVPDIRQRPNQPAPLPEVYLSYRQTYWPIATLVLRGHGDPRALAGQVRAAVRALDPDLVIDGITPLTDELALATAPSTVRTWLVTIFALAALLLAAIGLYGLLAGDVTQRTHEIGVRLALGAAPAQVRWMLVRRGLGLAGTGLVLGLVGALGLGRLLASLLFGISATDVAAFLGAGLAILLMALVACWLPARRAARLDPSVALRRE